MTIAIVLVLLAVITMLVIVWRLGADVHAIRTEVLPDIRALLVGSRNQTHPRWRSTSFLHAHFMDGGCGFFVVWTWRGDQWCLDPHTVPKGEDAGLPPAYSGAFAEDSVKIWVSGSKR